MQNSHLGAVISDDLGWRPERQGKDTAETDHGNDGDIDRNGDPSGFRGLAVNDQRDDTTDGTAHRLEIDGNGDERSSLFFL